jgi:rod shape-determining protein MreD
LTLPFAALGALIAALIETTVLPELPIAGAQPDLVFTLAVVATMLLSAEDGLVWAFVGGLLIDLLVPARPIGATTLSLLLVVGVAALASRVVGRAHRWPAVLAVFILTWLYQAILLATLVFSEGIAFGIFDPQLVLVSAMLNTLIAIPAVLVIVALQRRFGTAERVDW